MLPSTLALAFTLAPVPASTNVKAFKTSLFPNPLIDLVYVWYDDRHWSKILLSTIPTPMLDFKVKVTDLELLCSSFTFKYLGPFFQTLRWIWFMFV